MIRLSYPRTRRNQRIDIRQCAQRAPEQPRPPVGDISDLKALARWQPGVLRTLDESFDLGELKGRLCVVQCRDGRVVLFLLDQYVHSDSADELERLIVGRGFTLGEPARLRVPAPLLLTVSEQPADGAGADAQKGERSALASAFDEIVAWGVQQGASDIHFNVDHRSRHSTIRFSIEGQYLLPPQYAGVPTGTMLDMLAVAWMRVRGGNGAVFDPLVEQQGRLPMQVHQQAIMLRWASLAADQGPSVCLRVLRVGASPAAIDLASLGFLPGQIHVFEHACAAEGGAIVVAGTVGSGKSTTLATLLADVAGTRKLITLEDPVEYLIDHAIQNTLGRDLDQNDHTVFDAKLRTIKRSAADDLMIGEIRDIQTGRAFMDLVASGVRVYATTHTNSAQLIPTRLASDFIGVSRHLMACPGMLKLLVAQALFARLCENCAVPVVVSRHPSLDSLDRARLAGWLDHMGWDARGARMRHSAGCHHCRRASLPALWGYVGRTVVAEWLAPSQDADLLACIGSQDQAGLASLLATRKRTGDPADTRFWTLRECALHKVATGVLDAADVLARLAPDHRVGQSHD